MQAFEEYADRVNELTHSSADNILEIALAFYEAFENLDKDELDKFLSLVQYKESSRMIYKWKRIGESYRKLQSVKKLLPPVFTTIYKLARVEPDELQALVDSHFLNPSVTTQEIDNELNPKNKKQPNPKIVIEFTSSNCEFELKELHDYIQSSISSFVTMKMNEEARDLLDAANSKSQFQLKAA